MKPSLLPWMMRAVLLPLMAVFLASCGHINPHYDAGKPHHRPDGFANTGVDNRTIDGQGAFFRWQWERLRQGLPPQDSTRVPRHAVDLRYLNARHGDISVTWLGHSTALWQVAGLNILTDPHFHERASPVSFAGPRRETPLPARLSELPRIDVVLISHNHYDHLDRPTVLDLQAQAGGPPLFVVPLGVDVWLKNEGISRVQTLDWWDRHETGGIVITLVPSQHWSSRSPFDRNRSLWGGFVVQTRWENQPFSLYYVGDTGYSRDFVDIGARFGGFDFAQIPVGCYLPRWFMRNQHVNEAEAVQIHRDVKSRLSIGVHWGTFRLCDDPIEAPLDGLPAARRQLGVPDEDFVLLALGETRVLRKRATPP